MARHGLRVSETGRLKLTDVDLERRTIYVHRLKKGKPTVHPIYNGELKALPDWLKIRKTIVSPFDHLFLSEQRKPLSLITIWLLLCSTSQLAKAIRLCSHRSVSWLRQSRKEPQP